MTYYFRFIDILNAKLLSKIKLQINPCYLIYLCFQSISYPLFGFLSAEYSLRLWSPFVWWDGQIPFVAAFIPIYLTYYVILVLPLFMSLTKRIDLKLSISLATISSINYLISFTVMNEQSSRVTLENPHRFFISVLKWIYEVDANALYFPSLHAGHSLLIGFYLWKWKSPRMIFFILAFFICFSTFFVKQHFFLDPIGGVFFALVIFYFITPKIMKFFKLSRYLKG